MNFQEDDHSAKIAAKKANIKLIIIFNRTEYQRKINVQFAE